MLTPDQAERIKEQYLKEIRFARRHDYVGEGGIYIDMFPSVAELNLDGLDIFNEISYEELLGCLGAALDEIKHDEEFEFQLGTYEIVEDM